MREELLHETETLVSLFRELGQRLFSADSQAPEGELTDAQAAALRFLAHHHPNRVGDLAAGLSISYPAATKAIDRLVAKGLVDRRENALDRRQQDLTVTGAGHALLRDLRDAQRERLSQVLGRMAPDERRALLRGLRGFASAAFMTDKALIERACLRCGDECFQDCVVFQTHLAFHGTAIEGT